MDDRVADVDRRAVLLEQPLDDLDRAVDAGAERARGGEQHAGPSARAPPAPSARGGRCAARCVVRGRRWVGERLQEAERARAAVGRDRLRERAERLLRRVADRAHAAAQAAGAASTPLSMSTASAPVVLVQAAELGRVVDQAVMARIVPGRARRRGPSPSHSTAPCSSTTRVASITVPIGLPFSPPATPNETSSPAGDAAATRRRRPGRCGARPARGPLLRAGRAGERQPVSVHAMLRTVSFTLEVAANAADGSNPEWIPQCSQRGSFPGP